METSETRAAVQDFYRALRERDRERLWDLLAEDVDWLVHSPRHIFPFSGLRRGRAAVLEAISSFTKDYELQQYTQDVIIVEGPRAAAITDCAVRQRASGRMVRVFLADFTRFENGCIVEFRQFQNSFDFVEQALGREIDLSLEPPA